MDRDPILVEREKTHGTFADNADTWQKLCDMGSKSVFQNNSQRLAIEMVFLKLSRLLQCPSVQEHWTDLAGYAKLGAEACDGS